MADDKERIDLGAELGISESLLNDIKLATESEQQRIAKNADKKTTTFQELQKKYIAIVVVAAIIILGWSLYATIIKNRGTKLAPPSTKGKVQTPGSQRSAPNITNYMKPKSNGYQPPQGGGQRRNIPNSRPVAPVAPQPSDGGYDTDSNQSW